MALAFHRTVPGYCETPLRRLPALASRLGVAGIFVKDESLRFGLNAFKGLGGSYCLASEVARRRGIALEHLSFGEVARASGGAEPVTFVTATDGNHGRGVAWAARILGQRSVVYMPRGSAAERLENIRAQGADASVLDMPYDDVVRFAAEQARDNGWVLVQDTAWEGYEEIPLRIMQGYLTMASEALGQMGGEFPTHVFLQAGVGSMAAAVAAFFRAAAPAGRQPVITVVEPDGANCFWRSAAAGRRTAFEGEMRTIMAGLCCGVPSTTAWEMLDAQADFALTMADRVAADGMRILANPLGADPRIVSGESGASGFGAAAELLRNPACRGARERLRIGSGARILVFSTEGATDRENYRRIVWDGAWGRP